MKYPTFLGLMAGVTAVLIVSVWALIVRKADHDPNDPSLTEYKEHCKPGVGCLALVDGRLYILEPSGPFVLIESVGTRKKMTAREVFHERKIHVEIIKPSDPRYHISVLAFVEQRTLPPK